MSALLEFLESQYELRRVPSRPDELNLNCPICPEEDTEGHGFINLEKGLYNCFRCGGKTIRQFLMEAHDLNPYQIRKLLDSDKVDILLTTRRESLEEARNKFLYSENFDQKIEWQTLCFPEEYSYLGRTKKKSYLAEKAYKYMGKRVGRDRVDSIIKDNSIGFCSGGKYGGRLILPVFKGDDVVYFQARSFFPVAMKPSYLNPSSPRPLFVPFGLSKKTAIICEGYFDALAIGSGAMAIFGSSMTEAQLSWFLSYDIDEIIICLDSDEAGRKGSKRLYNQLSAFVSDIKVVYDLGRKDPGSLGWPNAEELIRERMKRFSSEEFARICYGK